MHEHERVVRIQHVQDLPQGAIRMSESEILNHHLDFIHKRYTGELWPLKYGTAISSAAASLSGLLINSHYRKKFKLQNFGRLATLLPTVCLPAMMSGMFHQLLITNSILVGNSSCSLCMQTKSGAVSSILGCLYPMIISPISCIIIARKYYTTPVPKITEGAMMFKFLGKTTPMAGSLFLLFTAQFVLGMVMANQQMTCFQKHLLKTTRDLDQEEVNVY